MARRANIHISDDEESASEAPQTSTRQSSRRVDDQPLSPSPAASFSSDKENHQSSATGKSKRMPPPKLPTPALAENGPQRSAKRRKLGERGMPNASQVAHEGELEKLGHAQFYDPNQSMAERRAVRKGIRDLSKELTGSCHLPLTQVLLTLLFRISCGIPNTLVGRPRQDSGTRQ